MKYLKFFENHNSKLYWEIEEYVGYFESWFGKGDDWSIKYFQCGTFEGLSQLLQELGLTK